MVREPPGVVCLRVGVETLVDGIDFCLGNSVENLFESGNCAAIARGMPGHFANDTSSTLATVGRSHLIAFVQLHRFKLTGELSDFKG